MNSQTPVLDNPLSGLGHDDRSLFSPGGFCAICARPGVGKTAFLVQMALWALSVGKNVLHVSLSDPIKKVDLWYQDLLSTIAGRLGIHDTASIWSVFLPRRFIMTFKVEGFSVPKLEERMNDLMEQNIFIPGVLLLDGLISDASPKTPVEELKDLARRHALPAWFSVQTQQYPKSASTPAAPASLQETAWLFDSIVAIEGAADRIHVRSVKGGSVTTQGPRLRLDPATLLLSADDAP